MKKLLTFLFCAIALGSIAQTPGKSISNRHYHNGSHRTWIHSQLEQSVPNYPGGKEAFVALLSESLQQPADLEIGQKVTVDYMFVVDADGSIDSMIELPADGTFDKETLRIMNEVPYWNLREEKQPGELVYFTMPVTFIGE